MVGCLNLSITAFGSRRLASQFLAAGLTLKDIQADSSTVIQCWVPTKQDKKRPAVILIHGFGANAIWQWPSQLKALSREFDLYVPNLIFFGDSWTSSPNRSEIFQAKSLMNVMELLGVQRFDVVGVSYGGFVAFRMAHLFPQAVERVVIASSGVCMSPEDVKSIARKANTDNVSDFLLPTSPVQLKKLMNLSFHKPPRLIFSFLLKDFINALYIEKRQEKVELLQGLELGVADAPPLPVLTQDSLVIWGEYDQIFPVELAHKVNKHLGEKSKLVIVKEASHAVQIEKADEFNEAIIGFLRRS